MFVLESLLLLLLLLLLLVNVPHQQPDPQAISPILVVVQRLRSASRVVPRVELDQRVHRVARSGDQVQPRGLRRPRGGLHPRVPDSNHGDVAGGGEEIANRLDGGLRLEVLGDDGARLDVLQVDVREGRRASYPDPVLGNHQRLAVLPQDRRDGLDGRMLLEQRLHPVESANDADGDETVGIRPHLLHQEGIRRQVRVGEVELNLLHDLVDLLVGERLRGLFLVLGGGGAGTLLRSGPTRVASRGGISQREILQQRIGRIADRVRAFMLRLDGHAPRVRSTSGARRLGLPVNQPGWT